MFITIICSNAPNSGLPEDWRLGYEGIADHSKIQAKVGTLLRQFARVKVFSQRICIGDFRRGQTIEIITVSGTALPKSVVPKSANLSAVPVISKNAGSIERPTLDTERQQSRTTSKGRTRPRLRDSVEKSENGTAVALKVGDRIKVGGHIYRIASLSPEAALAGSAREHASFASAPD